MKFVSDSDWENIKKIRAGSSKAFAALYAQYRGLIEHLCVQFKDSSPLLEADDIRQECIIALFRAVRRYKEDKGPFPAFVKTCMRNHLLDLSGYKKNPDGIRQVPLNDEYLLLVEDKRNLEEETIERLELSRKLKQLLKELSKQEHEVLKKHIKGLSYKEIGEELNISPKAVDSTLQRIRKKAAKIM